METRAQREVSLTFDVEILDAAEELSVDVSGVANTALRREVASAGRQRWLEENADAFAAQAEWHSRNGHPLADILIGPVAETWKS